VCVCVCVCARARAHSRGCAKEDSLMFYVSCNREDDHSLYLLLGF
jgi:hypothetical protein